MIGSPRRVPLFLTLASIVCIFFFFSSLRYNDISQEDRYATSVASRYGELLYTPVAAPSGAAQPPHHQQQPGYDDSQSSNTRPSPGPRPKEPSDGTAPAATSPDDATETATPPAVADGLGNSILSGHAIAPKLGNETAKAELGRASWKLFHTVFARFPDKPTADESEALRSYIHLFQRLYPW